MLQITIPAVEQWDEGREEFVSTPEQTLELEHSLVSISKWEAKWCKPFFSKTDMTTEEAIDYFKCMTLTLDVNPDVYTALTPDLTSKISDYINAPMTATWFSEAQKGGKRGSSETITSELIYYWMIALQIPAEYQYWHLNRLLTLVQVCNIKNAPPKKMGKKAIMSQNAALNAARRKQFNTNG